MFIDYILMLRERICYYFQIEDPTVFEKPEKQWLPLFNRHAICGSAAPMLLEMWGFELSMVHIYDPSS